LPSTVVNISFPIKSLPTIGAIPVAVPVVLIASVAFGRLSVPFPE
jgi:hypothetical protein